MCRSAVIALFGRTPREGTADGAGLDRGATRRSGGAANRARGRCRKRHVAAAALDGSAKCVEGNIAACLRIRAVLLEARRRIAHHNLATPRPPRVRGARPSPRRVEKEGASACRAYDAGRGRRPAASKRKARLPVARTTRGGASPLLRFATTNPPVSNGAGPPCVHEAQGSDSAISGLPCLANRSLSASPRSAWMVVSASAASLRSCRRTSGAK